MRALVLDRYRSPARWGDVAEPSVGPRDVLVEVHASGLNPLDAKIREGQLRRVLRLELPLVLGNELAGVVLRVGEQVTRYSPGDEVFGRPNALRIGTLAERIAVDEGDLAPKPSSLSMAEAASLPLVALTAWQALVERAAVGPGQRVLVQAGSGGLGSVAVQLAKHLGATVATTTGTTNVAWVRELGPDVVVDHRTTALGDVVHDYDVALDTLGGRSLRDSLRAVRRGGTVIGVSGPPDVALARELGLPAPMHVALRALSAPTLLQARRLGVHYQFLLMRADGDQLRRIAELVDAGALRPVLDRVLPFEEAPAGLAHVETGRAKGKVVVTMR